MFSLGYQEMLLIAVVALVVVSPDRLPEFLRSAGRVTSKLRRAATELQREINAVADEANPGREESASVSKPEFEPKHRIERGRPLDEASSTVPNENDAAEGKPRTGDGNEPPPR
jgi:sec-independent protein translocase protein TatB